MSEVEQLAQEQFNTFKTRLCEILSEVEEEIKSAYEQGYAKGETDEHFRTKQVVTENEAKMQDETVVAMTNQLTKAKELIKRLLEATYGEGWNYSLQVKVEAEKFLKESE